jgi:hypothetical protein
LIFSINLLSLEMDRWAIGRGEIGMGLSGEGNEDGLVDELEKLEVGKAVVVSIFLL